MLHMTAGLFGNALAVEALAKKLGKSGTINDIAIYSSRIRIEDASDAGSSEGVFTYVAVNSDKVQPLLQAVNMTDVPVLVISELNAAVGEQIIAISEFMFDRGFMMLDGISEEQIRPMIKGTCIEKFSIAKDATELVEELKKIKIGRGVQLLIPIDNYFNVKSVGTVALGMMKSGYAKKYDKATIEPIGREVVIKGIQSQDKDFESTEPGMRVGLNLKGIEADELKRGYVIGPALKSRSFKFRFVKSRYSKEMLKENDPVFISAGLQVAAAKVKHSGDVLELETDNDIAYTKDMKFLIATTKENLPRIIGHGVLAENFPSC